MYSKQLNAFLLAIKKWSANIKLKGFLVQPLKFIHKPNSFREASKKRNKDAYLLPYKAHDENV